MCPSDQKYDHQKFPEVFPFFSPRSLAKIWSEIVKYLLQQKKVSCAKPAQKLKNFFWIYQQVIEPAHLSNQSSAYNQQPVATMHSICLKPIACLTKSDCAYDLSAYNLRRPCTLYNLHTRRRGDVRSYAQRDGPTLLILIQEL